MSQFRSATGRFVSIACALLLCMALAVPCAAQDEDIVTLTADTTRWYTDDRVTAEGNVQATYRDFKVTAQSAEADLKANTAVFKGDVTLVTREHTVQGQNLVLNLKTKDWSLDDARTTIDPAALQGKVTGPLFIKSTSISGDEEELKVDRGTLTTCDLEHPHYYLTAKAIEIHPGKRIVARRVSMKALDHSLFTLPSLVIPIKGRKYNILPQIGSSAEEGMFLKTSYAYAATDDSQGYLKLDLMQKRGVGLGLDHSYDLSGMNGLVSLYFLADQETGGKNITGKLQHHQKLGTIDMNVTSDYRTNNFMYYPTTTSRNWQVALTHAATKANTALTLRSNSVSGTGSSDTTTMALRHTQNFSDKLTGVLSMDMRNYRSSGMDATDRELDSVFELRQRGDRYDLALVASRRTDLDGEGYTGDDYYSVLDRLPELSLQTDSYRSGINLFGLPFRLGLSAGKFHEEPSGVTSDRLLLQWDMLNQAVDIGSRSDLNLSAGFRQAVYASDMAQHVLKFGGTMTTRFNDYAKSRLTYNYQQAEGYSPFRFDYTGRYNYLRWLMDYQDDRELRWSLSTGYDFKQTEYPWQDIALRLTARPNSSYGFSISTGYDVNRAKWRNLINRFQISVPDRIVLDVGTRYDMEEGRLEQARGIFDYRINDKWRIEGITSWNGVSKDFDYKSFRLTRDLHCWEASLVYNDETGFRRDKSISLELRLKAFPTVDRFGIGQYGQSVDTSLGEYYY